MIKTFVTVFISIC